MVRSIAVSLLCAFWLGCGSDKPSDPPNAQSGGNSGGTAPHTTGDASTTAANPRDAQMPPAPGSDAGAPSRGDAGGGPTSGTGPIPTCAPRPVAGDPPMHFHHVHFNTVDPDADLTFFDRLFGAAPVEFCRDASRGAVTRATQTERGYFLYTKVATPPDPALNTYLEHVGWMHPSPTEELLRLVDLDATLFPEGRAQCAEAAAGQMACGYQGYWFYLQAPSGARIEVARGPGPATMGFGHVHMIMGVDLSWYGIVTGDAYHDGAIDMVNHTDVSLEEMILANETVVETRGKPIDHIGYSTTDLDAARARIAAAGITIEEEVSFKPEYGFRSFFVKDQKGIWVEIVEDSPFAVR